MKPILAAALLSMATALPAVAEIVRDPAITAVALDPMPLSDASLTVIDAAGTPHVYTAEELENFPTYALETVTPWRDDPAVFEGILLVDLITRHGLASADAISVVAENDFVAEISSAAWESGAFLIATRVDHQPHSRRLRGPLQFIVPRETYLENDDITGDHLIWMAAVIRAAD